MPDKRNTPCHRTMAENGQSKPEWSGYNKITISIYGWGIRRVHFLLVWLSWRELFQFTSSFTMPVGALFYRKMHVCKEKKLLRYLMFIVYHLQAYHSTLSAPNSLCKMAILPINTKFKGPAPPGSKTLSYCCIICKILSMACLSMFCIDQFSRFGSDHGIVCLVILKTYQANGKLLVNFSWK